MTVLGNIEEFAIEYEYLHEFDPDDEDYKSDPMKWDRYGFFKLWVKGKNLFAYDVPGHDATYTYGLEVLFCLFATYLKNYLVEDPFPVETDASNGSDMIDKTMLVQDEPDNLSKWAELAWEKVDMDIEEAKGDWIERHTFLSHRDGSFLPDVCIRRVDNLIEISWCSDNVYNTTDGPLFFLHKNGVEYTDIKLFKQVIVDFCEDFICRFRFKHPKLVQPYISNFEKAKAIEV